MIVALIKKVAAPLAAISVALIPIAASSKIVDLTCSNPIITHRDEAGNVTSRTMTVTTEIMFDLDSKQYCLFTCKSSQNSWRDLKAYDQATIELNDASFPPVPGISQYGWDAHTYLDRRVGELHVLNVYTNGVKNDEVWKCSAPQF